MTWLQEQLTKMGACQSQVNSATVKMVEKAMVEDSEFIEKTALDVMERLANTFEEAKKNTAELVQAVNHAEQKADKIISAVTDEAKREIAELQSEIKRLDDKRWEMRAGIIKDNQTIEAVKAYRAILEATKEVFGDALTESAIKRAIKEAGYVAYRGVMGPK